MMGHLHRAGTEPVALYAVPAPLNPPTELTMAAAAITLSADGRSVTIEMRERLARAIEAMPDTGYASAWYHLVDVAKRYLRDYEGQRLAPRFSFTALIGAAVGVGVPASYDWQRWAQ